MNAMHTLAPTELISFLDTSFAEAAHNFAPAYFRNHANRFQAHEALELARKLESQVCTRRQGDGMSFASLIERLTQKTNFSRLHQK